MTNTKQSDSPQDYVEWMHEDHERNEAINLYRAPDGLLFEVERTFPCGTVVTDAGLWISPEDFAKCERYV